MRPTAYLAAVALAAGLALAPSLPAAAGEPGGKKHPTGPPTVKTVTLVTGDVVRVSTGADGRSAVTLRPRPDGSIPQAAINQVHDHLYVVPTEAFGLLAAHRLDRDLFDVTGAARGGVRRRLAQDAAGHGRLRPGSHRCGRGQRCQPARSHAHRHRARARHRGVPRQEEGRPRLLGRPHPGLRRRRQPHRARGRRHPGRPRRAGRGLARGLGPADPRTGGLGRRVRRHRLDRRGARHRLRPHPPRPELAGWSSRPTSPPTRPSPTGTATAPTSPRPSAAAARPRPASARASPPAPT